VELRLLRIDSPIQATDRRAAGSVFDSGGLASGFARAFCCVLGFGLLAACDSDNVGSRPLTSRELREKLQDLYEAARDAGEDVPADAYEWARSDVQRIGDWEYRLLRLDGDSDEEMVARFNELGAERWEVFWMEPQGPQLRVYLKRPARSYLRLLPLSDLSRLVPIGGAPSSE
jgi:hypothetical protein